MLEFDKSLLIIDSVIVIVLSCNGGKIVIYASEGNYLWFSQKYREARKICWKWKICRSHLPLKFLSLVRKFSESVFSSIFKIEKIMITNGSKLSIILREPKMIIFWRKDNTLPTITWIDTSISEYFVCVVSCGILHLPGWRKRRHYSDMRILRV